MLIDDIQLFFIERHHAVHSSQKDFPVPGLAQRTFIQGSERESVGMIIITEHPADRVEKTESLIRRQQETSVLRLADRVDAITPQAVLLCSETFEVICFRMIQIQSSSHGT